MLERADDRPFFFFERRISGSTVWISDLQISNLRNIENLQLDAVAGLNVIVGRNGAGKTSILEAIYLAGRGRTFRHPDAGPLIRSESSNAVVVAKLKDASGQAIGVLGIERERAGLRCRFKGKDLTKRSELAEVLPVQFVSSQPQLLLSAGPEYRRRFLDLGLFHVEHRYLELYVRFQKVLKQRNAALRMADPRHAENWDQSFVSSAVELSQIRMGFADRLLARTSTILDSWYSQLGLSQRFNAGWKRDSDLAAELKQRLQRDSERGFTSIGPQRAEWMLFSNGRSADKTLSRGQQKILIMALNLAMLDIVVDARGENHRPVVLIDDLAAELDTTNRRYVLDAFIAREVQLFISMIDLDPFVTQIPGARVFHVEQGALK